MPYQRKYMQNTMDTRDANMLFEKAAGITDLLKKENYFNRF